MTIRMDSAFKCEAPVKANEGFHSLFQSTLIILRGLSYQDPRVMRFDGLMANELEETKNSRADCEGQGTSHHTKTDTLYILKC